MVTTDAASGLPVELALQIFGHLPLLDTWRLRVVSKAWAETLSSTTVVKKAVDRWDEKAGPVRSLDQRECHLRTQSVGKPLEHTAMAIPPLPHMREPCTYGALRGHHFACTYMDRYFDKNFELNLFDLATCSHKSWIGGHSLHDFDASSRQSIIDIVMTDKLVAVLSTRMLYTTTLTSNDVRMRAVELPKNPLVAMAAHEHLVVVLSDVQARGIQPGGKSSASIYDHLTQRWSAFEVPSVDLEDTMYSGHQRGIAMRGAYEVIVFTSFWCDDYNSEFDQLDLSGVHAEWLLHIRSFSLKGVQRWSKRIPYYAQPYSFASDPALPIDVRDAGSVDTFHVGISGLPNDNMRHNIVVNIATGIIEVLGHDSAAVVWKDTMYWLRDPVNLVFFRHTVNGWRALGEIDEVSNAEAEYAKGLFISSSFMVLLLEENNRTRLHAFRLDPNCTSEPSDQWQKVSDMEEPDWVWADGEDVDVPDELCHEHPPWYID